jgi:DNA-binding PadR family transcriptional regulator
MARLCIETALGSAPRGSGGLFRFIVLGLLRGCGPQHGYGLMKAFERRSGLKVSSGNFYRELRRLVLEGLVTAGSRGDRKGEERRLAYTISAAGMATFDEWFSLAPTLTGRGPDDLSARTLFFGDSNKAAVARLLEAWERDLWFQSKLLERGRVAAAATAGVDEFAILPLLLSREVRHLTLDVEFLHQVRTAFDEWLAARQPPAAGLGASSSGASKSRARRAKASMHAVVGARR